jgi:hypothetical protein
VTDNLNAQVVYYAPPFDNDVKYHTDLMVHAICTELMSEWMIRKEMIKYLYDGIELSTIKKLEPSIDLILSDTSSDCYFAFYQFTIKDTVIQVVSESDTSTIYILGLMNTDTYLRLTSQPIVFGILSEWGRHTLYRLNGLTINDRDKFCLEFFRMNSDQIRSRKRLFRKFKKGKLLEELGILPN